MAYGRSSGIARVSATANAGATMKFRTSATSTSRLSLKGSKIARGLRLTPAESMLLTKKVKSAILAAMRAASFTSNQ